MISKRDPNPTTTDKKPPLAPKGLLWSLLGSPRSPKCNQGANMSPHGYQNSRTVHEQRSPNTNNRSTEQLRKHNKRSTPSPNSEHEHNRLRTANTNTTTSGHTLTEALNTAEDANSEHEHNKLRTANTNTTPCEQAPNSEQGVHCKANTFWVEHNTKQ